MKLILATEIATYDCISINRLNLGRFFEEFRLSVDLFELLERGGGAPTVGVFGGVFIQYRIIAARNGALNLFHFGCSLDAIVKQLRFCPNLTKDVDADKLMEAQRLFKEYFPNSRIIRHAIAHAGELSANPMVYKKNKQRVDHNFEGGHSSSGGLLVNNLYERIFSVGVDGDVFSISIDANSVRKLAHVIDLTTQAFVSER